MASPTSPRGALSRWPTGPRAPSRRGRAAPHTAPTTTSSSPTRRRANPLDRSKVTKRFKAACRDAGVRPVRFHDLRHTFGTRLAASGESMRTIQEFLGHADSKTTQIYTHYAPSEHEVEMVNRAFAPSATGNNSGNKLSETKKNSEQESPAKPKVQN